MDNNQNPFAFLNNAAGTSQPTKTTGGNEFTFLQAREKPLSLNTDLGSLAKEEGAEHLMPVINAIYGQESGAGSNSKTSIDGARGGMQVMPDTFRRFAKPGEAIDNPADNMRVGMRIIKSLGDKFGNDPAKIATGYFSGEGNVNAGEGSAWKNDRKDGNGKTVSGYVTDVLGRLSPIKEAKAKENLPDLSGIPKWSEISASQKYLSLPDDEKTKLKGAYFDDVLAPHAGSESTKARESFMAQRDTAPGFNEKLNAKMAGVVPAVRDILGINGKPQSSSVMDGLDPNAQPGATADLQSAMKDSPTLRSVDASVENRRARLVGQGEDPRFAQRAAEEAAAAGIAPGAELAYMQNKHGTVGNSGFDFETSETFNKQTGFNNPLVRGAAKAGLGTTKAMSGYTQFAGEVLGIEGMQESGKRVGAWARGKEEAIGEKGTFLERNLEGAINSIGQQLPLMVAGVQMETTALPLAGMAMQTFGQEYSDGRSVGQTPVEATQRAAVFAAFEVIGEKFGLGDSMKAIKAAARGMPNDQIVGFLWSALKKEVPGELLTTTGQFATDKLPTIGLNQKATGEDYLKQVGDTIAQTIMQSGVMAGGTTGVSTAVRYLRDKSENSTVDAIHAEDTKQRVLDRWNQGPLGVPRDQITPDGRIEPVTPPSQPAPDVAAAPTAPIDVHPTSAVADSIVADLATQAGVPHEFVLPAQNPAAIPNDDGIADQDALDFAEMRYRQLLTKRDGRVEQVATDAGLMDQEVPGAPLSEAETAELTALEAANGNPAAIRTIYQAPPTAEVQNSVLPEAKPIADVTLTDVGNIPVTAQEKIPRAEAPAEPIDVTGRTDQALQYLSTNGQPGWKEAAIAEIEKRAAQQPTPQGQFASADEATAYIGAQRRASSAKLPKALPMPFGDGTFGVVTEGKEGWTEAQAYQKASAPKTEKEAKARKETAPVVTEPVATTKKPKNEREAALARIANGTAYFGTPEKAEAFIAKNKLSDSHTVEQTGTARFEIKPITNREQTNGNQATETVETQAQEPQAPNAGAGETVGNGFVEVKDLYGITHRVRQKDLAGERTLIPTFTKAGDRKNSVHRDNLDPTGQKKAALDAENADNPAFDVVTADQSKTFKTEAAAKAYATKNGYADTHQAVPAADVQAGLSGYLLKRIEQPTPKQAEAADAQPPAEAKQDEPKQAAPAEKPKAKRAPKDEELAPAAAKTDEQDKIEDFGEKIGGARKDVWAGFKDDLNAVKDEDIATEPFSKIWPAPDYQKLIDGGMSAEAVATIRALRDEVPAKPRASWKVSRWAEQVKTLREFANDVLNGTVTLQQMKSVAGANSVLGKVFGRIDLYQAVGHEKSLQGVNLLFHHYTLYKGQENVSLWAVEQDAKATAWSNWPRELATGKTKEDAVAAFKKKYATLDINKPASKEVSFEIYSRRNEKGYWIGKKVGRNPIFLEGPFANIKEARAFKDANHAKLVEKLAKAKEIPNERRESNEPRVGVDMRNGQDVTPQMFGETFGFKGVEFGNYVEQNKRQKDLNEAFDALMDMAAILNLPPKALSLNGELGLAFGARGKGGKNAAKAHYELDFVAINMTKRDGAGSLGHEWWHALDNYFSRARGKGGDMMTEALDVSLASRGSAFQMNSDKVRKEIVLAYGEVVRAIKQTAIKARSAKLDSKRSKEYWTTQPEMSARAFESYLISKLQDQNASNDYLANILAPETWKAAEALGFELDDSYPYPTAGEIPVIRAAFDKLFDTIETKAGENGAVTMFSRAKKDGKWYRSQLEDSIANAPDRVFGKAAQFKLWLAGNAPKLGIKKDEIEWSGINEYLDLNQGQSVTKADVLAFLSKSNVKVKDVIKSDIKEGKTPVMPDDWSISRVIEENENPERLSYIYNELKEGNSVDGFKFDGNDLITTAGDVVAFGIDINEAARIVVEETREWSEEDEIREAEYFAETGDLPGSWEIRDGQGELVARGESYEATMAAANVQHDVLLEDKTIYGKYVLPGGENYRELLLTLPDVRKTGRVGSYVLMRNGNAMTKPYATLEDAQRILANIPEHTRDEVSIEEVETNEPAFELPKYSSSHWDEANILAHIRFNDRTDANGNKVLFIEEIQSDWAQDGRTKGFKNPKYQEAKDSFQKWMQENPTTSAAVWREQNPELVGISDAGVPNAPFLKDTKAWVALSIKRMIAYAAENNYDKVAFVNGDQSAERYDLSKQIDKLEYTEGGALYAWDVNGNEVIRQKMPENEVEDHIGKDLSQKLLGAEKGKYNSRTLTGAELKVGGDGMKSFYDTIVPQVANDVLKKLGGGKVGIVEIAKSGRAGKSVRAEDRPKMKSEGLMYDQLGFSITPEMRETVTGEGINLFSRSKSGKGMALRDLNAIVDRARLSLNNLPQVIALKSPESLDVTNPSQKRLREEIYRRSAENDVEGANHEGDIYLFADNLADEFRAEHVLVNHEVGHYGLREVFGNSGLDPILNTIYMTNAKFRKKADAYREEFGLESNAEAVEEVLVDTPPEELIKLNGWRRIVRFMRDWLESHGFTKMSGRLNSLLKAGMSDQKKADLLVADVINAAREWVRNGEPSKSGAIQETKLSSAKTDRDRTNIETAARRMEKFVDEFTNGGLKDSDTILLGETPTVLQALGAEALPVQIDGFTLNKILGAKHRYFITPDLMKQIPEHLYDPLAVFDSPKDGKSGKVVLTELSDAVTGKPVIVAIHLSKKSGRLVVNEISSIYEANAGAQRNKLNESALEYYRNEKSLEQATTLDLSTPLASVVQSAQDLGRTILTEKDVVNTYGTKFSRKPIGEIVRNLQGNAVQFFGNQDLKTFNGLNKTINTQFHKALKDKDFGRVYNLIQSMQNHVATAAARPAELVPGILHRVDNVTESIKAILSKSQRQAIEKAGEALFAGTLSGNSVMDGRVWSEPELREKFGLDDTGVALYFQARKAIDASLDELAAAEAFAMAQNYLPKALREDIIESPEDAEALIMAALGRQIDMGRRAKLDDESMASMEDAREKVSAIFEQAKKLKAAGYAPLMRFGKYDLKVMAIDPATGNVERDENDNPVTLFYSRFESQAKLREAERELQARYADKLDEIRILPGVVNDNANELYRGVNPETLSVFAEAVGARQAMDDYIRLVRSERSAMKRRLERKGTPGYSLDVQRVLANFITSNARQAAQQFFGTSVNNAIRRIPREKGDVQKEALSLRDYVIDPKDNGALGSSIMFAWFLGGSPAAALVNMTQTATMTLPTLSKYGPSAFSEIAKAVPYALGKQQLNADLRAAIQKASLQGIVDAQEVFHLYAMGSRQMSGSVKSQAAMTLWGSMFAAVEGLNRRIAFIASWNMAIKKGMPDPYAFAVDMVSQTQGIYNKANRPNLGRNLVGRAALTFKTYQIAYLELMNRMWKSGADGKKAVLLMMAVLILAAGIEGLPGADDLDDIIDTIGQWNGYDTNVKRWKRRHAYELLGKVAGDLVLYGASSLTPLDFGGRLGMGNIIPGTGAFKRSNGTGDFAKVAAEIIGAPAGFAKQAFEAGDTLANDGGLPDAAKQLSPKAIKDVWDATNMYSRGYATDTKGRKTVETTGADAVIKGIGFNPTVIANRTRLTMPAQQDTRLQKAAESQIVHKWAQAIVDGDQAAAKEQASKMTEWNRDNPDTPIRITADQIRSKAKNMMTDKNSRIVKEAPKEIRGRIGLELMKN